MNTGAVKSSSRIQLSNSLKSNQSRQELIWEVCERELWGREQNGNDLFLLCLSIREITTILQMENLEIVTKYIENHANKKNGTIIIYSRKTKVCTKKKICYCITVPGSEDNSITYA